MGRVNEKIKTTPKSSTKKNMSRKSANNEDIGRHGVADKSSGKKKTSVRSSSPKEDSIIPQKKRTKTAKSSSGQKKCLSVTI